MPDVTIKIMLSNGQIKVEGPIHDKVLCYGLLELAKESIQDWNKQQKLTNIVIPSINIVSARNNLHEGD